MTQRFRSLTVIAALAAGFIPATSAQGQYYAAAQQTPPPLYPYVVQNPQQPYAVQVAPNTYVIQRPAKQQRAYPYVHSRKLRHAAVPQAEPKAEAKHEPKHKRFDRKPKAADRALIEELRKRHASKEPEADKREVVNTTKIVRGRPIVIEHQRVVDDPPRVIDQYNVVEDPPERGLMTQPRSHPQSAPAIVEEAAPNLAPGRDHKHREDGGKKRVIQADAEVTILGPDRMLIRLFRKGEGPKANARAN
ncbi:MAG: hypothetical protein ABI830_09565 [Pseudolabrys sp.]